MHALRRHGGLEVPAPVALVVFDVRVQGNHRGVVGPVRSAVASGGDRWRNGRHRTDRNSLDPGAVPRPRRGPSVPAPREPPPFLVRRGCACGCRWPHASHWNGASPEAQRIDRLRRQPRPQDDPDGRGIARREETTTASIRSVSTVDLAPDLAAHIYGSRGRSTPKTRAAAVRKRSRRGPVTKAHWRIFTLVGSAGRGSPGDVENHCASVRSGFWRKSSTCATRCTQPTVHNGAQLLTS